MFREMPRYVGFPNQIWVPSQFSFDSFERTFKGKAPFFVSTFRFKDKDTPIVDNLFFDIDSYYSVRFPHRNVMKLKNWADKHDIPHITNFSGGKGFHFYMIIQNIIPKTEDERLKTKALMYSVQLRLAEELGLEAYDEPTFGRLRFLCRFPTSKYIRMDEDTGSFVGNGMYCRALTDKEFDSGPKRIAKIVQDPGELPKKPRATKSLQEIADLFKDFKIIERQENKKEEQIRLQRAGNEIPTINALGLPCLKEIAGHSHPTHFERIEMVSWLKYLGYTDLAICAFIKRLGWTRYNYATTSYQVSTIKPRMVKCSFLRKQYEEYCKKCPRKR